MTDHSSQPAQNLDRTAQLSSSSETTRGYNFEEPLPPLSTQDQSTVDALQPGTALLIVQRGPNAGARFLLDEDETSSGRHPSSDVFLDDVTVSRRHVVFTRQGGQFLLRDVGSLNGTYVNRERVEECVLRHGDEVQIGKFRLVFYQGR